MPADPGASLRAAALTPRSPLDTAAVLRRARSLRVRRRTVLAAATLTVALPLLVLPVSRENLRFTSPGAVVGEGAAEQACAALRGPRVHNENGFAALGLRDELPRRLVEQTTVVADRCVVDERSGDVVGAVLRLEDEAVGPVAWWLLLSAGTRTADLDLASWLLEDAEPFADHVLELDGAVAIVRGDETAILAGDPSEPQVSAWDALVQGGVPDSFATATLPVRFTRPLPFQVDMAPRFQGQQRASRVLPSGIGTRLRLPSGREVEVVLPAAVQAEPRLTYRPESVGIVLDEARTPRTSVTIAAAREVGAGMVSDGPTRLPNGAVLEVWRGAMGGEPLVTATLAGWTLVLDGPDGGLAERIVSALDWSVDTEGSLVLTSTDEQVQIDEAVSLDIPTGDGETLALSLGPGCENAGEDLERDLNMGVWCADGFTVIAQSRNGGVLQALHEQLRALDVPREDEAAGVTVYRDPAAGLEVTYPRGWTRAAERLTPHLGGLGGPGDLVEVLTLGNGPLPAGGGDCANVPELAVEELGSGDALVTVQERLDPVGIPPRPARFGVPDVPSPATLDCFANADEVEHVRYDFADSGRGFYAYVTVRRDATAEVRTEALAILDSLVVEPR